MHGWPLSIYENRIIGCACNFPLCDRFFLFCDGCPKCRPLLDFSSTFRSRATSPRQYPLPHKTVRQAPAFPVRFPFPRQMRRRKNIHMYTYVRGSWILSLIIEKLHLALVPRRPQMLPQPQVDFPLPCRHLACLQGQPSPRHQPTQRPVRAPRGSHSERQRHLPTHHQCLPLPPGLLQIQTNCLLAGP